MKIEELKKYYVGQRFVFRNEISEVFELHITDIEPRRLIGSDLIHCRYRYLESATHEGANGNVEYCSETIDEMIDDGYWCNNGWDLLSWMPIKPLNSFPEDLFNV